MRERIRPSVALLGVFSAVTVADARSQNLALSARGGSVPGVLEVELGPGPLGKTAAILLSGNSGPTPLRLVDPRDPRVLRVGTDALGATFVGVYLPPSSTFRTPKLPVPNDASFLDAPIYWQGLDLPGTTTLVGGLSHPAVTRFWRAGSFRDRNARLATGRIYGSILPTGDGRWMICGGGPGGLQGQMPVRTCEIYDVLTDRWVAGPSMASERSMHTTTELADGRWLLAGGLDTQQDPHARVEIWDPARRAFVAARAMSKKRAGHAATRLPDGRVFVTGGLEASTQNGGIFTIVNSALRSTEFFDPKTGAWTRGPDMVRPRAVHEHVVLPDGRILVIGGAGWVQVLFLKVPTLWKDCEIYDPKTNRFTAAASMTVPRAGFAVADLGKGRYLVTGGASDLLKLGAPTNHAEIYDAATGRWTAVAPMGSARGFHVVTPWGTGRFLHIGGIVGPITGQTPLATTEVYDVASGRWSPGPRMNAARGVFTVYRTPMGQLQVISGQGTGTSVLLRTELFYP